MNKLQQKVLTGCGIAVLTLGSGIAAFNQQYDSNSQVTSPTQVESSQSNQVPESSKSINDSEVTQPVVETKTEAKTRNLPYETKYVDDNTLAKGTTKTTQNGVNGVETTTYTVTYTDDKETAREIVKVEVTQKPVNQIIARGTYVAPKPAAQNCTNGTYVNSAGNTVCRPVQSNTRPAGATARCNDGSYSHSQNRSGTCSHHGGVAQWY